MTGKELDAVEMRWGKHFIALKYILESWYDAPDLVKEVKRLTKERDAAVADLREAITTVCDDECKFCKYGNSTECAVCSTVVEDKWEWRGVRE